MMNIEKENNIIPEETKECAKRWIETGKPCRYRNGCGFRGASSRELSKEEALKLLPKYDFGMGFYELSFEKDTKVDLKQSSCNCIVTYPCDPIVLMFNEYSANDMY